MMKYLCDPQIVPAVMPNSLSHVAEAAERAKEYAQWLHVDIMDGVFAPNPLWQDFEALNDASLPKKPAIEVHLMTAEPRELGARFARAGAKRVLAHIEALSDADEAKAMLAAWKVAGAAEAGIALKIDTPLSVLAPIAEKCDFVQLMSISDIGYQGKPFDERAISRVEEIHAMYPDMMVCVDGGISEATVEELVRAGANRLVIGGAIAQSSDPARTFAHIHARAMRGCEPLRPEVTV